MSFNDWCYIVPWRPCIDPARHGRGVYERIKTDGDWTEEAGPPFNDGQDEGGSAFQQEMKR